MYKLLIPLLKKTLSEDRLTFLLIFFSSILLGIWAIKGTIALRNFLLGIEVLLTFFYFAFFFKGGQNKVLCRNRVPIIFLCLMFCWVILHFFLLTRFPDQQLHEIKSTWLRSFLAMIVGLSTGIVLRKTPNSISLLWVGILVSFIYLFYEYVPNAIALKRLLAPDYVGYIFYGKISGVLVGTILLAGLLGTMVDAINKQKYYCISRVFILWLVGTTIVLYSYVFIFDTRNGIGLAIICYSIIIVTSTMSVCKAVLNGRAGANTFLLLGVMCFSVAMLGWFGAKHLQQNAGWSTMWEDTKIAVQVEKYPNWQNPGEMGYPLNALGQVVKVNTYERVAWAMVGATILLPQNPLGVGVLTKPFNATLKRAFPNSADTMTGTHSGWVDIALAFGYPGLFLMLGALVSILCISLSTPGPFQGLTSLLSLSTILLFTIGELGSQHAIEMLCFLIGLMSSLLPPSKCVGRPTLIS